MYKWTCWNKQGNELMHMWFRMEDLLCPCYKTDPQVPKVQYRNFNLWIPASGSPNILRPVIGSSLPSSCWPWLLVEDFNKLLETNKILYKRVDMVQLNSADAFDHSNRRSDIWRWLSVPDFRRYDSGIDSPHQHLWKGETHKNN